MFKTGKYNDSDETTFFTEFAEKVVSEVKIFSELMVLYFVHHFKKA